jgi:outer membrane protein TolC
MKSRMLLVGCWLGLSTLPAWATPPAARLTGSIEAGSDSPAAPAESAQPSAEAPPNALPIDLPAVLRLTNASNPTIALARARVDEAFNRFREARSYWLPNLSAAIDYNRHDGTIQNAAGFVFNTNKQNLFYGAGAAFTWQLSDAIYGPLVARQLMQAQSAAARAVDNDVQLDAALAYLDLLRVYGQLAINAETLAKAEEMQQRAVSAERNGLGKTPADANRARTETDIRRQQRIDLEGQAAAASARLAQLLFIDPTVDLKPTDPAVLPIALISADSSLDDLLAVALMNRPELAESRSLVQAAIASWRQARVRPYLPRFDFGYSGGDFGGGINSELGSWGPRGDAYGQVTWELQHMGFGDLFEARARQAQVAQANFRVSELTAQVGADVTTAYKVAAARARTLQTAQHAVRQAEVLWYRLELAAFGVGGPARQYDPLEPLLAEQALDQARSQYLTEVIEFNRAQFRLYWALGRPPLDALPGATAIPIDTPVLPTRKEMEPPRSPPGAARP